MMIWLFQPLRKAFNLMGTPSNLIPDSFDGQMSFTISNYLRKLKKQVLYIVMIPWGYYT